MRFRRLLCHFSGAFQFCFRTCSVHATAPESAKQPISLKREVRDSDVMDNPSSVITQVSRDEEGNKAASERVREVKTDPVNFSFLSGSSPSLSSKKPRSRGLFSGLFCCLCRDQPEPPPVNNNAPLLVEENGTVSKVKPLLPPVKSKDAGKICVVIDLDETLVHSSFKPVNNADFIIPVEIDGTVHQVYVLKRPHVDEFLKRMGELFECVLFTASLAKRCKIHFSDNKQLPL
ncbi:hypothetical protein CCH79_00013350 [Gambusia affinis]|uniref:Mitochondrial import inner membrane translocase subunit TIM50 n=1 Tax=Gambusia affinis TaxID=33528 RepID=A0A315W7V6_GAMAF|nr:hypothetical protein CCH79_00013350 [Gambusia affinis]